MLIVNPRSGDGAAERAGLSEAARERGIRVIELGPDDDLPDLARSAVRDGCDCLGMAGGDGSLALIADIAIQHRIPFVCVPAGTRNHFALDLGLDVNAANDVGETALHGATYHAAHKVIEFLVSKGADINARNWSDQTPWRLAMGHFYSGTFVRYLDTAALLQKLGADINAGTQLRFSLTGYDSEAGAGVKPASTATTEQK